MQNVKRNERECPDNKPQNGELVTQLSGNKFILHSTDNHAMIKFICKDMENKVSKMKFVSGLVKFVVQPLCSAITPSNKLTGQLAFVADLPGFEVRPLELFTTFEH